jgi:hypothetical protein
MIWMTIKSLFGFPEKRQESASLDISISPRRVSQALLSVVFLLTVVSILGQYLLYNFEFGRVNNGLLRLFNVDEEHNIPTWYQSFSLLFCSILLVNIAMSDKLRDARYAFHWKVLAVIFLCFSIDEAVVIHERVFNFKGEGFLYFFWVIPGIIFVVVFAALFLKFLQHLPGITRFQFIIAGSLFISGALGMEIVDGYYHDIYGWENMTYSLLTSIEEFLEMLGVVVFINAIMTYTNMKRRQDQSG